MSATRGTAELERAGVEHRLLRYAYGGGGAVEAAERLGVEPERMYKSLVARAGDELVFALVPADAELDLKALARAAGTRSAEMAGRAEAERATGYQAGGMSPLGARRRLAVFLDQGAGAYARICLNAGGRGHIVEVALADLERLTGARLAAIAR